MRYAALLIILALILAFAACGGGKSYQKEGAAKRQAAVALENCRWEATHEQQPDGSYIEVDKDDDDIEAYVKQCMQKKGFELKEESGGSSWWPF